MRFLTALVSFAFALTPGWAQIQSTGAAAGPLPADNGFSPPQQPNNGAPGMVMPLPLPRQAPPPPPPKPVHHGPSKAQLEREARAAALQRRRLQTRSEALDLLTAGKAQGAAVLLENALKESPTRELRLLHAAAEQLSGRADSARADILRVLKSDSSLLKAPPAFLCAGAKPKPTCAELSDGLVREAAGDAAGALKRYDLAVRAAPKLWLAHALRGIMQTRRGDCGEAIRELQYAATLQPAYASTAQRYLAPCPQDLAPEPPAPPPSLDSP